MVVYDRSKRELVIPIGWGVIEDEIRDYSTVPMGLKFPKGGSFYCCKGGSTHIIPDKYFYVSLNGGEWQQRSNLETEADKLILQAGDTLRFKGENVRYGSENKAYGAWTRFVIEGEGVELSGNIMSLCYGDNFSGVTEHNYYCLFPYLFLDDSSITNAEHLVLPIKSVPTFGYFGMFQGCYSLLKSPVIEADTVAERGMTAMFQGCNILCKVRCNVAEGQNTQTENWLYDVAPTGTFYGKNVDEWVTGASGIPEGWERIEL